MKTNFSKNGEKLYKKSIKIVKDGKKYVTNAKKKVRNSNIFNKSKRYKK